MTAVALIDWSLPSTYAATGVHHGYRTAPGTMRDVLDHGKWHIATNDDVHRVWWGMLEPGGFIVPHIDQGPYRVRWHYPIEPAGYMWQEHTGTMEAPTEPFTIRHWEPHAVWNPTDKRRVHLIVELETFAVDFTHDLELHGMLPEIQELIDGI